MIDMWLIVLWLGLQVLAILTKNLFMTISAIICSMGVIYAVSSSEDTPLLMTVTTVVIVTIIFHIVRMLRLVRDGI